MLLVAECVEWMARVVMYRRGFGSGGMSVSCVYRV